LELTAKPSQQNMAAMPQLQLPIFPHGSTPINDELAFERRAEQVTYFNGHLPVFTHEVPDVATFRLYTTQLILNGTASHGEMVRAFGVPLVTVKRCVKRYRQGGAKAFYQPAKRKTGTQLTPERLAEVQTLLDQGWGVPALSAHTGVLKTTLHKALDDGRLKAPVKKKPRANPRTEVRPRSPGPKANAVKPTPKRP
jgi:transposase